MYCGRESVSLSTVSCQLGGRVVFIPLQYELCTCSWWISFHRLQCGHAGCILPHLKQHESAGCIHLYRHHAAWMGVCIPFHSQQCGHEYEFISSSVGMQLQGVSILSASSVQCGHAGCIALHCQQCELGVFSIFVQYSFCKCQNAVLFRQQNEKHANVGGNLSNIWMPRYRTEMPDVRMPMTIPSYAFSKPIS